MQFASPARRYGLHVYAGVSKLLGHFLITLLMFTEFSQTMEKHIHLIIVRNLDLLEGKVSGVLF